LHNEARFLCHAENTEGQVDFIRVELSTYVSKNTLHFRPELELALRRTSSNGVFKLCYFLDLTLPCLNVSLKTVQEHLPSWSCKKVFEVSALSNFTSIAFLSSAALDLWFNFKLNFWDARALLALGKLHFKGI
jgi:hypothetical protein